MKRFSHYKHVKNYFLLSISSSKKIWSCFYHNFYVDFNLSLQIHVGVFKKIFYKKWEKLETGGIFIYMQMYKKKKRMNLILKKASRRKEKSQARTGRITVTEDETWLQVNENFALLPKTRGKIGVNTTAYKRLHIRFLQRQSALTMPVKTSTKPSSSLYKTSAGLWDITH